MTRSAEPVFWTNFAPAAARGSLQGGGSGTNGLPAGAAERRPTLDSIGSRFGSDKASAHHDFLDFYERFLAESRDTAVVVMELGVNGGESVQMWEEFFPHARVVGVDNRPDCVQFARGRIEVGLSEPGDVLRLVDLAARHGPFDLIVDDWTHMWEHQIGAFRALYPFVRPGGYYILEDIDTSYGDYVPMFRGSARMSAATYLHAMTDLVVSNIPVEAEAKDDAFLKSAALRTEFVAFHKRTSLLRRRVV